MSRDCPAPRTITLSGTVYATPFRGLLRPLSVAELADLEDSIRRLGVRDPVHTYDSPSAGPAIIDGLNRVELAAKLGVEVPTVSHPGLSDEAAHMLALELNAARRQLSFTEANAAREVRVKLMRADAEAGKSTREIARRHGVNQSTVSRSLNPSSDAGASDTGPRNPGRSRSSRPDPATPDPVPGEPPTDLRGLALVLLEILRDWPDDTRITGAVADPADPRYPVTLARLRAAVEAP